MLEYNSSCLYSVFFILTFMFVLNLSIYYLICSRNYVGDVYFVNVVFYSSIVTLCVLCIAFLYIGLVCHCYEIYIFSWTEDTFRMANIYDLCTDFSIYPMAFDTIQLRLLNC